MKPGELVWSFCSSALWEKPFFKDTTHFDVVIKARVEPGEAFIVIDTLPEHYEIYVVNSTGQTGWISTDVLVHSIA